MKSRQSIFTIILGLIFLASLFTNWYEGLVISLLICLIVIILYKLGNGILLRETVALHMCFICLFMPMMGYLYYNQDNETARLWVKYMLVPKPVYFDFALPAVSGFVFFLCLPIKKMGYSDYGSTLNSTIERARKQLMVNPKPGIYILAIGTAMLGVSELLPSALQFAFLLFYFAAFAGYMYIFHARNLRLRVPILVIFSGFILLNALSSGMFTVVAYMGLTLFSFFFLGSKTSFLKKALWFIACAFMVIILQNVKQQFRDFTWKQKYAGNKVALFTKLMSDEITDFSWKSKNAFFPIYVRTNQGFNISLVMRRIPQKQEFDKGDKLLLSFAAALVPRFLWPDKPEAGGQFNMQYYAGVRIEGWSTNIGPLGEAYGSFGVIGGISFMCALGIFIRWVYRYVFSISRSVPLLIFWIPVLFYQVTYSSETDTLQILNSLIKSAFFIWLLYKLLPGWFGKERRERTIKRQNLRIYAEGPLVSAKV